MTTSDRLPTGRCQGCGEIVEADHGTAGSGYGHTLSQHHWLCNGYECAPGCPVPEACGPIDPEGGEPS